MSDIRKLRKLLVEALEHTDRAVTTWPAEVVIDWQAETEHLFLTIQTALTMLDDIELSKEKK